MIAMEHADPSLWADLAPVLLAGILGIGGGLGGVVIGRRVERRDEHRVWLRNRRLEAYSEFNAALDRITYACGRLWSGERSLETDTLSVLDIMNGTRVPMAAVTLLGPSYVREAAVIVDKKATKLFVDLLDASVEPKAYNDMLRRWESTSECSSMQQVLPSAYELSGGALSDPAAGPRPFLWSRWPRPAAST